MKRKMSFLWILWILPVILAADDPAGITTTVLAKSDSSWDGAALPAYPRDKPEITILRITIPPGRALPRHQHPVINAGFLLSGELTIITEDHKKRQLKPGDSIIEVVNTWHQGTNTGKDPTVIIVFYASAKDKPITIKKADHP